MGVQSEANQEFLERLKIILDLHHQDEASKVKVYNEIHTLIITVYCRNTVEDFFSAAQVLIKLLLDTIPVNTLSDKVVDTILNSGLNRINVNEENKHHG